MVEPRILVLPTFVAGPENEGRGYGVLAQSGAPVRGSWTIDLPMILFEWAKLERGAPFAACLPVGADTLVVCRGRFFRRLPIGHVSYLHGVLLGPEACHGLGWHTETVAALIPDPNETLDFARAPLELTVPPLSAADWPGLGLAWQDRILSVEPPLDPEKVLMQALRSVDPIEQRRRIAGWTTSIELAPRGAIAPLRQCQLAVIAGPAPAIAGFMPMRVYADGSAEGESVVPPPGRATWERLHEALLALPELADDPESLRWQVEMGERSPEDVAIGMLRAATALLDRGTMIALLQNLVVRGDAEFRPAGMTVLEEYVAVLARDGQAGQAAAQLAALLAAPGHGALAHRVLAQVDAAGFERAPASELADLLQLAIGLLGTHDSLDRARLRPLAEIALAYGDRCEAEGLPLAPVGELVGHWPPDAADMLDGVMTANLVTAIGRHGRAALTSATRKLVGPLERRSRARPMSRAELIRQFGVLLAAIRLMEKVSE